MTLAIDLESLLSKKARRSDSSLLKHAARRGALGSVTALDEMFDIYLINNYSTLNTEALMQWLKMAQVDTCFRKIIQKDENIRDCYLQEPINVTIASDRDLVDEVKKVTNVYWLLDVHTRDIEDQIHKVISWKSVIREVAKFAWTQNNDKQN